VSWLGSRGRLGYCRRAVFFGSWKAFDMFFDLLATRIADLSSNRRPPKRDGPSAGGARAVGVGGTVGLIAAGAAPKKYESLAHEAAIKSNTRSHENDNNYFRTGADRRSWRGLFGPRADERKRYCARRCDLPRGRRLSALDRQAAPEDSTQRRLFRRRA
jgi:hypothetical protein